MRVLLVISLLALLPVAAHAYIVEEVASGLQVPWSLDFASDGRIFLTERGGAVRIIDGELLPDPVLRLNVGSGEGGLLGIALDPSFAENRRVYLYYTYGLLAQNRVSVFTETERGLENEQILLDNIPGHWIHDGGRIAFGPDGMLYVTTGDAANTALSQDVSSLAGKILRLEPDGRIPPDNPFPDSPVYSYGHRNPQGLDWDVSGRLVATEHGPSGERGRAHDEINVIESGANYGWPMVIGDEHAEGAVGPALHTGNQTWAPSGAAFYRGDIKEWDGMYMVAALASRSLVAVDPESWTVQGMHLQEYGRLRDAVMGPDGALYVLTSNRDGRGAPSPGDDFVLRVVPSACTDDRVPVLQVGGQSACVFPDTVQILVDRGWAAHT